MIALIRIGKGWKLEPFCRGKACSWKNGTLVVETYGWPTGVQAGLCEALKKTKKIDPTKKRGILRNRCVSAMDLTTKKIQMNKYKYIALIII